jgi:hypothetical protein
MCEGLDVAIQHMRHESYSQVRHQHMKIARIERDRLINDGDEGFEEPQPTEVITTFKMKC